jgi:hypothetical protein
MVVSGWNEVCSDQTICGPTTDKEGAGENPKGRLASRLEENRKCLTRILWGCSPATDRVRPAVWLYANLRWRVSKHQDKNWDDRCREQGNYQ